MMRLVWKRLVQLPLLLLAVYTLTLALAWGIPGNPLDAGEGQRPPEEAARAMEAQYNLQSFWSFYAGYLDDASGVHALRDAVRGRPHPGPVFDLGPSLRYRDQRVSTIIADALPVSVRLGAGAMAIALVLGVGCGVAGSLRPGGWVDQLTLLLSVVGISLPTFVAGAAVLAVTTRVLGWRPGAWGAGLVLPAFTLALPIAATIARLVRAEMVQAMASDYVRTARAKGLPERAVVLRHALGNSVIPVLAYLGPASAGAMTGSFAVELIFTVPGMGQHFVAAVQNKDLFLIMGVVLTYATMLIVLNLGADLLVRWADPRAQT